MVKIIGLALLLASCSFNNVNYKCTESQKDRVNEYVGVCVQQWSSSSMVLELEKDLNDGKVQLCTNKAKAEICDRVDNIQPSTQVIIEF